MKKYGFTLSEILITIAIIGVISVMTIPTLLENTSTGADMVMLKSMVNNIDDMLKPELTKNGGKTLSGTTLIDNPMGFLKKFNYTDSKGNITPFGKDYKSYNNGTVKIESVDTDAAILMANGAGVGIKKTTYEKGSKTYDEALIYIDVNGSKKPNIIGVDLYALKVIGRNEYSQSIHVGDLKSASEGASESLAKSLCKTGSVQYCYYAAEASGFDPNYLDK